jgi:hypothetical protein
MLENEEEAAGGGVDEAAAAVGHVPLPNARAPSSLFCSPSIEEGAAAAAVKVEKPRGRRRSRWWLSSAPPVATRPECWLAR